MAVDAMKCSPPSKIAQGFDVSSDAAAEWHNEEEMLLVIMAPGMLHSEYAALGAADTK